MEPDSGQPKPDPEALLRSIRRADAASTRGRLKVFLGMCPGVGKTYAMLEEARRELASGVDLVVGWIETHGRKETDALAAALPTIQRRTAGYRGVMIEELDLEAILARRPSVAVVDELAHSNRPGSRHPKRWQDVAELLEAGIDVLTTLNVQHVESVADTVRQITGIEIRELVPDRVLDGAVLRLVDLPAAELLARLRAGKVYLPERAAAAGDGFFREANLTALRELALRLVADHVGIDTRGHRESQSPPGPWKTGHCLMVGVGPSPYSERLIRWTRRMADAMRCRWLGVHVSLPGPISLRQQEQLKRNLATARELGAEVFTTSDLDLVRGLLRIGRRQNATLMILGKPAATGWIDRWRGERFLRRLVDESGDIDVHLVRAEKEHGAGKRRWEKVLAADPWHYGMAAAVVGLTGVFNAVLMPFSGPRVPGLVFLLVVVLLALKVGRGAVLLAGALSALIWNYFFLPPRYTLAIGDLEDVLLFTLYFIVAIVLGQLVARIRTQEHAERQREASTVALYDLTRDLAEASSRDEVVWQLITHVDRLLKVPVAVLLPRGDGLSAHPDGTFPVSERELGVAAWAFQHGRPAGRSTDNLPGADGFHLPLLTERRVLGVLVIQCGEQGLLLAQRDLLDRFIRQAALMLDRVELRAAASQAKLLAESETFSRTLLNSISHELRTPLAASTAAASALAAAGNAGPGHRQALLSEILEANARLNRVVGNLLNAARLESGKVQPHLDWHDARDLVQTTLRELQAELASHPVILQLPQEPLLVRIDFSLMQHALGNLLLNAATHTPGGTPIEIKAGIENHTFLIKVSDRGPGIPEGALTRIFDKFYRAPEAPAGGSGLGLTLVKGFVEAQGGAVDAGNRAGGGCVFTLRVPVTEVPPEEVVRE